MAVQQAVLNRHRSRTPGGEGSTGAFVALRGHCVLRWFLAAALLLRWALDSFFSPRPRLVLNRLPLGLPFVAVTHRRHDLPHLHSVARRDFLEGYRQLFRGIPVSS